MGRKIKGSRLKKRSINIWSRSFLVYTYLWPDIKFAVQSSMNRNNQELAIVLDIGCGEKPYRDLFGECLYYGLNYGVENASPDMLGDAMNLPVADSTVDLIFSTQVIEHLPEPKLMVGEMSRVLKSGGEAIVTGPFFWPIHEEPYDFYRYTKYGFAYLAEQAGLEVVAIKENGGIWAMIGQAIALATPKPFRPIVLFTNVIFLFFDKLHYRPAGTMNYTLTFRKR